VRDLGIGVGKAEGATVTGVLSGMVLMAAAFAEEFRGMTRRETDRIMQSSKSGNCRINKGLVRILRKDGV
jgi:hypothetical protein